LIKILVAPPKIFSSKKFQPDLIWKALDDKETLQLVSDSIEQELSRLVPGSTISLNDWEEDTGSTGCTRAKMQQLH
jgi:hypothetical protein